MIAITGTYCKVRYFFCKRFYLLINTSYNIYIFKKHKKAFLLVLLIILINKIYIKYFLKSSFYVAKKAILN